MYTGYRTIKAAEAYDIYQHPEENMLGLLTNEYLIVKDEEDNVVDIKKWDGYGYCGIDCSGVSSRFLGTLKARNLEQKLAIDMLRDPGTKVKFIDGPAGSGKDVLMLSYAIHLLEKGKFEKIVFVRNNVQVRDTNSIGYLPGSQDDKLRPYAMLLADHLGGTDALERMITSERLELCHLGFMRGRSIRNSLIYVSEGQNLSLDHLKMIITRVDDNSELWLNSDMAQIDMKVFEMNNGVSKVVDKLKGNSLFGYVRLQKVERSAVAQLAALLD